MVLKDFGLMDYEKTNLMMQSFNDNRGEDTEDEIWILEHEPVYTYGISTDASSIPHHLSYPIIKTDRGGEITYHGLWAIGCLYLNGFSQSSDQTKRVHWKVSELNIQSTFNLLSRLGIEPRRDRHLLQASKDSKLWLKDNKKRKLSWSSN